MLVLVLVVVLFLLLVGGGWLLGRLGWEGSVGWLLVAGLSGWLLLVVGCWGGKLLGRLVVGAVFFIAGVFIGLLRVFFVVYCLQGWCIDC